jgi:hypothetical protein
MQVVLVACSVAGWRSLATTRGMTEELAKRESINRGYMSRVSRFAHDIVDASWTGDSRRSCNCII